MKRNAEVDFKGVVFRNALEKASRNLLIESVEMMLNMMIDSNVDIETYTDALEAALKFKVTAERRTRRSAWRGSIHIRTRGKLKFQRSENANSNP